VIEEVYGAASVQKVRCGAILAASRNRTRPKARATPARTQKYGRCSMPTFMCFLNWTDQGARAVKDAPKRYEATKAIIAKLGGRLVSAYVTTGQYDVVLTVEMPNGDAMTKFAVSLTSTGNARTTTVRAIPPEEFGKLAAEAP
jgi:uncharacterized protein with GYD domain